MFTRVGFPHVHSEELKVLITIVFVEFVEGRDLAHERWSGDTPEF